VSIDDFGITADISGPPIKHVQYSPKETEIEAKIMRREENEDTKPNQM
jgi:hypothetical protein